MTILSSIPLKEDAIPVQPSVCTVKPETSQTLKRFKRRHRTRIIFTSADNPGSHKISSWASPIRPAPWLECEERYALNDNSSPTQPPHSPRLLEDHLPQPSSSIDMPLHVQPFDDDCQSEISPLKCGSITPDARYDPAKDPAHRVFVPPPEIMVRTKEPVPDWLKPDYPIPTAPSRRLLRLARNRSVPSQKEVPPSPQPSPRTTIVNGKQVPLSPRTPRKPVTWSSAISIGSLVGQSSLHTSPTGSLSSDESEPSTKKRLSWLAQSPLSFQRQRPLLLRRARGCLT